MKVWRRLPDAEELWRLEHVGEECGMQMHVSSGGRNCASIGMLYTPVIMIPGSGEVTVSVALHRSVTAKV